ncbi:MAG: radical SAM-associated putative lipoprotein [Bacteroidales bacterium]|jgi:putative lipoprotein (rSAM/lipoprotein system)|nr:radical SAM-associated putative lipoprotein [Bacteroidales bacterium]
MKIKILKTFNILIAGLLAILGFATACVPAAEYGTPSAKFIVNGNVKSSETDQPIKNIRVSMQGDTTYTDANGAYQVIDEWGFPTDQTYNIEFQDIDGNANGVFSDLDTIVEFKNPEFSDGDGSWYRGETSKEFDVKLTPKK